MKVLVLLVGLALLAPLASDACTLVNAKIEFGGFEPCVVEVGKYITIGSSAGVVSLTECNLNGDYTKYHFSLRASCTSTPCYSEGFFVTGSNLSGTYEVRTLNGNCVELCACP